MKKTLFLFLSIILVFSISACGKSSSSSSENNSNDAKDTSSSQSARISFDSANKTEVTYKEHVQELWNKTKILWSEDAKKKYTEDEYLNLGKEIDLAWVNLQAHISIASNGHDETLEDTSDGILGNMIGDIIMDNDKLYGTRSLGDTSEELSKRRTDAISYLESTLKDYDDILSGFTIK